MKSWSLDLISGPEKLSRMATPTMGAWNFQTIRRRALLHWPTSYWWHQVSREKKQWFIAFISGTTLHGINVSLSIQELGVGTGQRLKKRYRFLWIKMGHCNILSCNYFAKVWETFAKVKFSLDKIQLVKRNESAWNYLRVCVNSLILCSTLLSRLTFVWWESISCLCEWPSISISCFLSLVDENMTQGSSGRLHWFGLCQWTAWTRWY